jgi:type I restriction enzyme S subunit
MSKSVINAQEWKAKNLGEVCDVISRGVSPKYIDDGGICVLNQRCIRGHKVDWTISRRHDESVKLVPSNRLLQFGDGLINSTGTGTLGRVAQILNPLAEPTTVDSHITIVRPRPDLFYSQFFGYMLADIEDQLKESGEGCGGQTELARSVVAEKFIVRFPSCLKEQERIVVILDEAFEGIATAKANAQNNLENARHFFESCLESRFSKGGAGWLSKPLAELCEIKHGFAFKSESFRPSGDYVLLTPGNFYEHGGYRDRGEKQKYYEGEFPKDFLLNAGDLLVAMTEQAAGLLGSPIIVPDSGAFLHNQRLGLVTRRSGVPWLNEFFFHVFNTSAFRKAAHDSASGVKVRHTSPTKLGEILVSFPQSVKEQQRLVSEMEEAASGAQQLEAVYNKKVAALDELKQSLLHQAFTGKL